jgi:hypothetical protein
LPFKSRAGLNAQGAGSSASLADRAARGNTESPLGSRQFGARKTSEALVPPNPNELDKAA